MDKVVWIHPFWNYPFEFIHLNSPIWIHPFWKNENIYLIFSNTRKFKWRLLRVSDDWLFSLRVDQNEFCSCTFIHAGQIQFQSIIHTSSSCEMHFEPSFFMSALAKSNFGWLPTETSWPSGNLAQTFVTPFLIFNLVKDVNH